MTVSSDVTSVTHDGDGTTLTFSFPFKILAAADLRVTIRSVTGSEVVLTLGLHYSVAGVGDPAGGTITLLAAAPLATDAAIIERVRNYLQETVFPEGSGFPAATHEQAHDARVMQIQQLKNKIDRGTVTRIGDTTAGELPLLADRASKYAGWDAAGQWVALAGATPDTVPVSSAMAPLLAASSIQEFLKLIGLAAFGCNPQFYGNGFKAGATAAENYASLAAAVADKTNWGHTVFFGPARPHTGSDFWFLDEGGGSFPPIDFAPPFAIQGINSLQSRIDINGPFMRLPAGAASASLYSFRNMYLRGQSDTNGRQDIGIELQKGNYGLIDDFNSNDFWQHLVLDATAAGLQSLHFGQARFFSNRESVAANTFPDALIVTKGNVQGLTADNLTLYGEITSGGSSGAIAGGTGLGDPFKTSGSRVVGD